MLFRYFQVALTVVRGKLSIDWLGGVIFVSNGYFLTELSPFLFTR